MSFNSRNTFGCCKNCKDRCVEPNCHTTCERYLKEIREAKETEAQIKAKKKKDKDYNEFKYTSIANTKKFMATHRPRTK